MVARWFFESNRWKHFAGGALIGFGADGWFCAMYSGVAVGAALEFKDKSYSGNWDTVDWAVTIAGAIVGRVMRVGLWQIIGK